MRSHTGALAGSDAIFNAVCRDEGVTRVEEPEDLLAVARMLSLPYRPAGRRVLVYTLSGGGASVLADELAREALAIPELDASTHAQCDALGNPFIRAANPFDVGGSVFSDARRRERRWPLRLVIRTSMRCAGSALARRATSARISYSRGR